MSRHLYLQKNDSFFEYKIISFSLHEIISFLRFTVMYNFAEFTFIYTGTLLYMYRRLRMIYFYMYILGLLSMVFYKNMIYSLAIMQEFQGFNIYIAAILILLMYLVTSASMTFFISCLSNTNLGDIWLIMVVSVILSSSSNYYINSVYKSGTI